MALESTTELRERLRNLGRRDRQSRAAMGLARIMISLLIFGAAFFLADWMLGLPPAVRLLLLAFGAAGLLLVGKLYLYDPLKLRYDEETVALRLERQYPELQDCLISAIQLTRPNETLSPSISPALVRRLELDTALATRRVNFWAIIDWRFLRIVSAVTAGMLLMAFAVAHRFPEHVAAFLSRIVLGEKKYPTATRVEVPPDVPHRLVKGEDWPLRVEITGRIPHSVALFTRPKGVRAEWQKINVKPELGRTYAVTIERVQEAFEYRVFAGDARTDPAAVEVLIPVAVSDEPRVSAAPPQYTGMPPIRDELISQADVFQGSEVEVFVPASKQVVGGTLVPLEGEPIVMTPSQSGLGAVAKFTADRSMYFTVRLKDADGLQNEEPYAVYRLRYRPDRPPKAALLKPRGIKTLVPFGCWTVQYSLSDDVGVSKAWLAWRADAAGTAAKYGEPRDLSGISPLRSGRDEIPVPRQGVAETKLDLVPKQLAVGNVLTVWIEAADAVGARDGETGGHVARSAEAQFEIVDEKTKLDEWDRTIRDLEEEIVKLHDGQEAVMGKTEDIRKEVGKRAP